MLDDVSVSHNKALEAVDRGSKTLKEANETYHILAGKVQYLDFNHYSIRRQVLPM